MRQVNQKLLKSRSANFSVENDFFLDVNGFYQLKSIGCMRLAKLINLSWTNEGNFIVYMFSLLILIIRSIKAKCD